MEYTFKNTVSGRACSIALNHDSLTIQTGGEERSIPYSRISFVKLSKSNGKSYKMTVKGKNSDKIHITNKYYLPTGECEDRSKQYTHFVKVFHSHLRDKSNPVFISDNNTTSIVLGVLTSAFISVFVSFVLEFFGIVFLHPLLQAGGLMVITAASIYLLRSKMNAVTYKPDDIPDQFLP